MAKIKLLFLDIDGTLTDGKIYMGVNGEMFKAFDIKDGCGIHDILPKYNIIPVVLSARKSEITANRCKELNITHIYQGIRNKAGKMVEIFEKFNIEQNEFGEYKGAAYIGDDIIDIEAMKLCEYRACPGDAVKEVKEISHYVAEKQGGKGAVRECIERIVKL